MDLKQLEYFVRVAELGSFTRASGVLNIAQSALSRQVRLLEVELRQALLQRNGRGVTTTEAGRLLLEHGRGILHQVARAHEDLGRVGGALAGRVVVGLPPSIARMLAVPLTREFRQNLPMATLSITEGLTIAMQEWLLTGRLDIALLYNPSATPEIDIRPLIEEELFLISLQDGTLTEEPISLQEIAELPLVIPSRPNSIRVAVEARMASLGCKPRISLEIDGIAAVLDLVADGAGHAILPRYALAMAAQPQALFARPIMHPQLLSQLVLATSAGRTSTMIQQATSELLAKVTLQSLRSPSSVKQAPD